MYPILTTYSVNKAVNEKKLTTTLLGNTRYYRKKDIENFIESNKKNIDKIKRF